MQAHLKEVQRRPFGLCLCTCSFILIGEVILYLFTHIFSNIFMVEEFEDGLCLFYIDTEEFTVLIDALWVESLVQRFLNFQAVALLYFTCELTLKGHRYTCSVKFPHPLVNVFLRGHSNLYKTWHYRIGQ